jgi:diaminopimelate epimerase
VLREENTFVKGHALGNDYIVLDPVRLTFPLTAQAIQRLCDRHTGIGSDGILALAPSHRADFGLRIYNPDGSEAEKSGNGLRIFGKFLYDHGYTTKTTFTVETLGGLVGIELRVRDGTVQRIAVEVGKATFSSTEIPAAGPPREVLSEEVEVGGERLTITAVSVGNPHCVVFVPDLSPADLRRLGPQLEHHPLFPHRTNVQFAKVESPHRVSILIWERGAGETLASGTSASAVVAAGVRRGFLERHAVVAMPGGELEVSVSEDWTIRLVGDAQEVYQGRISGEFLRALREG